MRRETRPTFLDPESYRGRRLQDAARVVPILGCVLFLLPVLWLAPAGQEGRTATIFVYIFVVWALLILAAAGLSRGLSQGQKPREDEEEGA